MAVTKIDPKVIFASEAPAQDTPAVFVNKTVGWGEARKNGGRPTIKQSNALQQETDLKILWLNENAVTPYDSTIDYPQNAVTIKDGEFKILKGGVWSLFLDKLGIEGLSEVDNTSDLNKPVSVLQQEALNLKADKSDTYTKSEVDTSITSVAGGRKAYQTLALAQSEQTSLPPNTVVDVTNDPISTNNGTYQWNGTTLTKSDYDPVTQANNFSRKISGESINIAITGDTLLTVNQIEFKNIQFTGALTADATITLPAISGNWVFRNLTTGGFKVLVKCDQQTVPPVSLFNNEAFPAYASGRNLFNIEKQTRYLNISMTGRTELTLTDDQVRNNIIFFGGTMTQDILVTLPKKIAKLTVRHQSAGGFAISFKVQDSALSAILIKNGSNVDIVSDAINVYAIDNDKLLSNGGTLTNGKAVSQALSINDAVANNAMVGQIAEGGTYIAITGDTTLTIDQAAYRTIVLTGALTADATITLPKGVWDKTISNKTTGGFTVYIKCIGQSAAALPLYDNLDYSIFAVGGTAYFKRVKNQYKTASVSLTGLTEKTLTQKEYENDVLFIGGTLTQDTTVIFPKVKGRWEIRHQGTAGFKLLLKTLDSADAIEITNGQFIDVVSDAVNLYLINKQNQTGEHKGAFKDRATYNMNDIVEHGSGRYKTVAAVATNATNPMDNYRFKKIGNKPINNKTISVLSESSQAINGTTVRRILSTSKDGSTVFSNQPYAQITESKDFGATWTKIADIAAAEASLIEQMDNGELILYVTESAPATTNLVRRIYTTVGYGTENVQLVSRLMSQRDKCYFSGQWGFDMYKNIILATEYGAKYKPDADVGDASWVNVEGGNARYVWLSLDYGKTWRVIFDLNSKTNGIGVHIHNTTYDPYWNRIWVHHGDGATGRNGMYYSDDLGATWTYALQNNATGANFSQATCTVVLPDCILFGSDSAPNGVYRLDRSQGKTPYKGYYQLETAWKHPETSDTVLNAVCYKVARSRHAPDMPYIFGFAPESNPTKGVIVATFDGYNFFQLWQDSTTRGVGYGVRHVVGVTLQNEIIARVQDDRFGSGVQTELRLKVI